MTLWVVFSIGYWVGAITEVIAPVITRMIVNRLRGE